MAGKGPSCLVLTPDEKHVIASARSAVGVWDIDSGEAVQRFDNGGVVTCSAVSPDGIYIVTGGGDGVVRVWLTANGAKHNSLLGHEGITTFFDDIPPLG